MGNEQQGVTALPAHLKQRTNARYHSQPGLNSSAAYQAEFNQKQVYYNQNPYHYEYQGYNNQYAQGYSMPGYYDQEYDNLNYQSYEYGSTGSCENQNYVHQNHVNPNYRDGNNGNQNLANQNYENQGYGNQGYGDQSGNWTYGNQSYGYRNHPSGYGDPQREHSPAPNSQNGVYGQYPSYSTSSLPVSAKHNSVYPPEPLRASSMGPGSVESLPPVPPPHSMNLPPKAPGRNLYMHENNTVGNVTRSQYFHNSGSSTSLASAPGGISIYGEPPEELNRLSIYSTGSNSSASTALSTVSGQSPLSSEIRVSSSRSSKQPDRIARMNKLYGRQLPTGVDGESNLAPQTQPQPTQQHQLPMHRVRNGTDSSNGRQPHLPTKSKTFNAPMSIPQTALNLSNHAVRNPQLQSSASAASSPSGLMESALPRTIAPMAPLQLDLDIPPIPNSQSEPVTPIMPPPPVDYSTWSPSKRGTPSRLARLFGIKGRGDAENNNGSNSSRTGTPSIASRISSRISSRLSSNSSNRGSVMKDPAQSVASLLEASMLSEPRELQNDWHSFEPRRLPNEVVTRDFAKLGKPRVPLVDIDPALEGSIPQSVNPNKAEMRQFATRGIYYLGEKVVAGEPLGETDDDGNYKSVKGEQLGYRYSVVDELGRGSFGTVIRCRDHRTGRMVAVKITANRAEIQGQARIEAKMLRALLVDHKGEPGKHHFLRYIEHFQFQGHLCIATELLGPNLFEMSKLNSFRGLSEPTVQYISRQLVEGLEFLVNQNIIHCDLKPENILVSDTEKCQVKIVDFGSSCYERSRVYTYIQSRFYRAPEILLGMPYGPAIDMWSLGAIIPELLVGRPIFPSVDEADQVALMCEVIGSPDQQVMWKCRRAAVFLDIKGVPLSLKNSKGDMRKEPGASPLGSILSHCSPDAVDFCSKMLQWAPEKRITAAKAVYHPFVLAQ